MVQIVFIIGLIGILTFLMAWKENAVVCMVLGGISAMVGLYTPDIIGETTGLSLSIGLLLMAYWLLCWGWAFRLMFWEKEVH